MYSDREPIRRSSLDRRRFRSRSRSRSREQDWDRGHSREWSHDRYRDLESDRLLDYSHDLQHCDFESDRLKELDERIKYSRDKLRECDDRLLELDRERRDLDRIRDREYERDRERLRDRVSTRRSRSRSRERISTRRDYDYDSRRSGHRLPEMEITSVIMIRDVAPNVTKEDIVKALGKANSVVNDIRCVHKNPGTKGFGMLEFSSSADAREWMEENRDLFKLGGEAVNLEYCRQRKSHDSRSKGEQDWECFKCQTINFFRRRVCLTCDTTRAESEALYDDYEALKSGRKSEVEIAEEGKGTGTVPTNVLIFKGLDVKSNELSVRRAVKDVSAIPLKAVRIIKNKTTDISRGFCFVELETLDDATELLQIIKAQYPAFFVDGRRVAVSYGRNQTTNNVASAAIAQAQWSMTANALETVVSNLSKDKASTSTSSDSGKPHGKSGGAANYPSTYSYDESSGFYFDSATGLYYDPKTQYHYNSQTGLYCYYDAAKLMYISVDKDGNPVDNKDSTDTNGAAKTKKLESSSSKPPTAKQIAKDMERWSKKVNAAKSAQQQLLSAVIEQERTEASQLSTSFSSRSLDPVSSLEFKKKEAPLSAVINMIEGQTGLNLQLGDSDGPVLQPAPLPEVEAEPLSHIDWNNLACLLCKRKFSTKEMLLKHEKFSDLHKTNLAKMAEGSEPVDTGEIKYRDRAKERRAKYGTPAVIPGWKKRLERELVKEPIPHEEPTKEGINEDNVGNRLLQAMGWSAGEGLGKDKQGIVDPIQAERRVASAGLGATGSKLTPVGLYSSAGSYKETLKSLTRARFEDTYRY